MGKKAFITGISGQDGSYLSEFLCEKGYEVHGLVRPSTRSGEFMKAHPQLQLHHGDLTDGARLMQLMQKIQPDEIYNLGAQSHVGLSFEMPVATTLIDGLGTLHLLEAMRILELGQKTRFYQASTSELYGMAKESPQSEETTFHPRSPYAVAKLYAHWITINYREAYGFYACNGILFNHESPRRGQDFVTRKITQGLCRIAQGLQSCLYLGNLNSLRDWGHAKDYVRMQWLMLQQEHAEDYVIATGEQYTVRDFFTWAAAHLGIQVTFKGKEEGEHAVVTNISGRNAPHLKVGDIILRVDQTQLRPSETEALVGDASKAQEKLGWKAEVTAQALCAEMVKADLKLARQEAHLLL